MGSSVRALAGFCQQRGTRSRQQCGDNRKSRVFGKCQAFPDPSYAVRVLAVPASFACTLTQTNDSLPLLAYSVGAGITSRLTRQLDIWSSVCCLPSSRPLACWLGRPGRPAARQRLTSPIFTYPSPIPPDRIHTSTVSLPLALQRTSSLATSSA